jgi:hypothetical protein
LVPTPMSQVESKTTLDSDRSSSDGSLEDGLPWYARASANGSSRFFTAWEHRGPWIARQLDKLPTEGRPAGARGVLFASGIRRIISLALLFGACAWLVIWAFQPLFQQPSEVPLAQQLSGVLQSNNPIVLPPGTLDVRLLRSLTRALAH